MADLTENSDSLEELKCTEDELGVTLAWWVGSKDCRSGSMSGGNQSVQSIVHGRSD